MLYPQHADKFEKTITSKCFKKLQDEAANRLKEDFSFAHPDVVKHWQSIVDGVVPFGYKVSDDE